MGLNEETNDVLRKLEQYKRREKIKENQSREEQKKLNFRRKVIVGEMFIRYFPIALQFAPGNSIDEDKQNFEPLEKFMEMVAKCQQSFQNMENDALEKRLR